MSLNIQLRTETLLRLTAGTPNWDEIEIELRSIELQSAEPFIQALCGAAIKCLNEAQSDISDLPRIKEKLETVECRLESVRDELRKAEGKLFQWNKATSLPDDEQTVLICCPDEDEPVWLGYYESETILWGTVDGDRIKPAAWASLPDPLGQ